MRKTIQIKEWEDKKREIKKKLGRKGTQKTIKKKKKEGDLRGRVLERGQKWRVRESLRLERTGRLEINETREKRGDKELFKGEFRGTAILDR